MHLCEITNGPTDSIWLILEFFADLNLKDNLGNTALHYALKTENKHMLIALLLFGANPELANNEEKKPCDMSKFTKDELDPIVEKITKYKINFMQFTRKRRKKMKSMFDYVDNDSSKTIGEHKLKV